MSKSGQGGTGAVKAMEGVVCHTDGLGFCVSLPPSGRESKGGQVLAGWGQNDMEPRRHLKLWVTKSATEGVTEGGGREWGQSTEMEPEAGPGGVQGCRGDEGFG